MTTPSSNAFASPLQPALTQLHRHVHGQKLPIQSNAAHAICNTELDVLEPKSHATSMCTYYQYHYTVAITILQNLLNEDNRHTAGTGDAVIC